MVVGVEWARRALIIWRGLLNQTSRALPELVSWLELKVTRNLSCKHGLATDRCF
jgi:hypothetical protein